MGTWSPGGFPQRWSLRSGPGLGCNFDAAGIAKRQLWQHEAREKHCSTKHCNNYILGFQDGNRRYRKIVHFLLLPDFALALGLMDFPLPTLGGGGVSADSSSEASSPCPCSLAPFVAGFFFSVVLGGFLAAFFSGFKIVLTQNRYTPRNQNWNAWP